MIQIGCYPPPPHRKLLVCKVTTFLQMVESCVSDIVFVSESVHTVCLVSTTRLSLYKDQYQ